MKRSVFHTLKHRYTIQQQVVKSVHVNMNGHLNGLSQFQVKQYRRSIILLKKEGDNNDPFDITKESSMEQRRKIDEKTRKMSRSEVNKELQKLTPEQEKQAQERFFADVRKYDTPEEYMKQTGFQLSFSQRLLYRRYKKSLIKKQENIKKQQQYRRNQYKEFTEEDLDQYKKKVEHKLRILGALVALYLIYYYKFRNDGISIEDEDIRVISDDISWTRYHFRPSWANISSNMAMIRIPSTSNDNHEMVVYSGGPLTDNMKEYLSKGNVKTIHVVVPSKHHIISVEDYLDWEGKNVKFYLPPDFSRKNYSSLWEKLHDEEGNMKPNVHVVPASVNTNQIEGTTSLPQNMQDTFRFNLFEGEGIDLSEIILYDKRYNILFVSDIVFNFQGCVFKPNWLGFSASNGLLKLTGYHGSLLVNAKAIKKAENKEKICKFAQSLSRYRFSNLWMAHGEPILEEDHPHLYTTWALKWKRSIKK